MGAISLRNIPSAIEKAIRAKARQKGISVNKAVIELLQERIGLLETRSRAVHHDLDTLAGAWTASDRKAFEKAVGSLRVIDEDQWR